MNSPALNLKFTKSKLKAIRDKGEESLYYFVRGILGNDWLDKDFHYKLCLMLDGKPPYDPKWRNALVCGFRGSLKTTVVSGYVLQRSFYVVDHETLLVEQKEENAIDHHQKIQNMVKFGPNAGLIQELFKDRIPPGFEGWNRHKTMMVLKDPQAGPTIQVVGLESKTEGKHPDLIVCDDLEGADADKSDVPNKESERFVFDRSVALMKDPNESRKIVLGTPHGPSPIVWTIRDSEVGGSLDPKLRRDWSVWWEPVIRDDGTLPWPSRFGAEFVQRLERLRGVSSMSDRMVETQYYLKKYQAGDATFDIQKILSNCYRFEAGRMLVYEAPKYGLPSPETGYEIVAETETRRIDIRACRRFLHIDPIHKDPMDKVGKGSERPSEWGILATAVSPDFNVFVLEEWIEPETIDGGLKKIFEMYRRWRPYRVSFESIGAQRWLQNMVRIMERGEYQAVQSLPTVWDRAVTRLPRMSQRMVPMERNVKKEPWIAEQLEAPHNLGIVHLSETITPKLILQHSSLSDRNVPIDGLDALAQGPEVWSAPLSRDDVQRNKFGAYVRSLVAKIDPITRYQRPWT